MIHGCGAHDADAGRGVRRELVTKIRDSRLAGAGVILHDREDQVGVEGSEPEALARCDKTRTDLRAKDGGSPALDRLRGSTCEHPTRVIGRQTGSAAILLPNATRGNPESGI